jgi:hypothetical protein
MVNCQLHLPSESFLTDLETELASDSGTSSSQPLRPEPSILSTIPGTPHADLPCSLPSPDFVPELHPKIPQTEPFRRVASQAIVSYVGTPSAVGAIRKPSMLSQFVLQTHINFPRFLPIFPDFLERLSHLAPIC